MRQAVVARGWQWLLSRRAAPGPPRRRHDLRAQSRPDHRPAPAWPGCCHGRDRFAGKQGEQERATIVRRKDIEADRQGIHLLVIDLFPPTKRDPQGIHKAIWDEFVEEDFELPDDRRLTLAAYDAGPPPMAYVEPIAVGAAMPEMPIFLKPEFYVPRPRGNISDYLGSVLSRPDEEAARRRMIIAHTGTVESFVGWVQPTGNTARPVGCTHLERLGAYDTGPPPVAYVARLGGTGFASAPLTAKNGGRTSRSWICATLLAVSQLAGIACGADGPRSPAESMKAFVLADPNLALELVASEPEVTSPVAIAWDEDGRLYVAEMTDYPAAKASGRIRRLEDRDGDGRYEHATVFADGLPFPNGVLPCYGGVLVTAAPNIWFLQDTNGDGQADRRQVVLTGFGEGNTQLRVNGLYWGLDNAVYVANGRSDGDVTAPGSPNLKPVSIRRRDAKFSLLPLRAPGGSLYAAQVEAIAGFSQFGLAHDDWGNRFPSWNTIPIRHVVLEQQTLDRNPYLAESSSVASILDPADGDRIYGISPAQARFNRESVAFFNASCGPTIERGDLLPARYHGNAFVCEPLTNLVHRRVLEPSGLTFIARRVEQGREFLASTDPAFRPVNLATGPDGALYVVDMYRELVEHPQFVPEAARASVDFRRWHDRGRIWPVRPKVTANDRHQQPTLSKAPVPQLVELLNHPNGWWRNTAQRLLFEHVMRRSEDIPAVSRLLTEMVKSQANPQARLHGLWILAAIDRADEAILSHLAADPHPAVREHALRVVCANEEHGHKRLPSHIDAREARRRRRHSSAPARGDCSGLSLRSRAHCARGPGKNRGKRLRRPVDALAILSGLAESSLAFLPLCKAIPAPLGRSELQSQAAAIVGVRRRMPELAALLALRRHDMGREQGSRRQHRKTHGLLCPD